MSKRLPVIVLILTLVLNETGIGAQETALEFGQPVTGAITETDYEFEYPFSGAAVDVVIAEMRALDPYGALNKPVLMLMDANRQVLADTTLAFSFTFAVLAAELPADGDYILLATRLDGRTGDSVGEFSLELIAPAPLAPDMPAEGRASSEGRSQYFVVRPSDPFSVSYHKTDGDMVAQVSVSRINPDDGGLREIAVLGGEELTRGVLGEFPPGAVYVVSVGQARYSFSLEETAVDFELALSPQTE